MLNLLNLRLASDKIAMGFEALHKADKSKSQKTVIKRLGPHDRVKMADQWDMQKSNHVAALNPQVCLENRSGQIARERAAAGFLDRKMATKDKADEKIR